MKYFILVAAVLLGPGCGLIAPLQEQAAGKIADGVNTYCDESDATFRAGLRADVNSRIAPRSIVVDCAE